MLDVKGALDLYERLVELPNPKSAVLTEDGVAHVEYTTCSIARNVMGISTSTIIPTAKIDTPLMPQEKEVSCTSWSPTGRRRVVFRSPEPGTSRTSIQIWSDTLEDEVYGGHEEVSSDDLYGSPCWSEDESTVVYAAKVKDPRIEEADSGARFHSRRSFGVFVLRLGSSQAKTTIERVKLPGAEDSGTTYIDPQIISTNPLKMAVTRWRDMANGIQLGLHLMSNRPTEVCIFTSGETALQQISPVGRSARSPRVKDDDLVYLSNQIESTLHHSCTTLHSLDLSTGKGKILIDVVRSPDRPGGFPGIYPLALPSRPFAMIRGERYIILSSPWAGIQTPLAVNIAECSVHRLSAEPTEDDVSTLASQTALAVQGDCVSLIRSSLNSPPVIVVARIIDLRLIDIYETRPKLSNSAVHTLKSHSFGLIPLHGHSPGLTLVSAPCPLGQLAQVSPPLLLYPHGGPNMTDTTAFDPICAAFTAAGFAVLRPDYPGSIGYGQDYVQRLSAPAVSVLEVDASLAAFESLQQALGYTTPSHRRFYYGLSHGGYIGAWVAGRHHGSVTAMVLVNPVTYMPALIHSTDIPDLYFRSCNLPFSFDSPPTAPTPEEYATLQLASPLSVVDTAKTPTLVIVSSKDSRICPEQGKMWHHALVNNKADAKLISFKGENHSIDTTVEGLKGKVPAALEFLDKYM